MANDHQTIESATTALVVPRKRIPKSGFLRNVIVLFFGTGFGHALAIMAAPVITRLYDPNELGRFALFLSFVGIAASIVSLRFEFAIASADSDERASYLVIGSVLIALPVALLLAAILGVLIQCQALGFEELPFWAVYLAYGLIVTMGMATILRFWWIRKKAFGVISRAMVVQGGVRGIGPIPFGFCAIGWSGLAISEILARFLGAAIGLRLAVKELAEATGPFLWSKIKSALQLYWGFAIYGLPSTLLDNLTMNLALPMIGQTHGAQEAGWFSLVQRVLALPSALLAITIADAFHAEVCYFQQEQPEKIYAFFLQTAGKLLLLGLGPTLIVLLLGPQLFSWVFGPNWLEAGQLASIMAPYMLAHFVVSPLTRILILPGGLRLKLIADVTSLSAILATWIATIAFQLSLVASVVLLSALGILSSLIYFGLLLYVARSSFVNAH